MSINKFEINQATQDKDGGKFEFKFEGTPKNNNLDIDKIKKLINKFMTQISFHDDMVRNLKYLRTILKDFNEEWLILSYKKDDANSIIRFVDSRLVSYEKSDAFSEVYNGAIFEERILVNYTLEDNINFKITDFNNNVIQKSDINSILCKIKEILDEVYNLTNVESIKLNNVSKMIIEAYKLFYDGNPNFADVNINIKVQTMISILSKTGVSFLNEFGFLTCGEKKIPMSEYLSQIVFDLFPLGEIIDVENSAGFTDDVKKRISIIGEEVRKALETVSNKEDALINIAKVLYAVNSKYNYEFRTGNIDLISKSLGCTNDETISSLKLINVLHNKSLDWRD